MAYTFMDDYGNEWIVTTLNPIHMHHQWLEITDGEFDNHHLREDGNCYINGNWSTTPCGRGDRALTWSAMMAMSDAETEASPFLQADILSHELSIILNSIYERECDFQAEYAKYEMLRDSKWLDFYKRRPDHPYAAEFIAKHESSYAE